MGSDDMSIDRGTSPVSTTTSAAGYIEDPKILLAFGDLLYNFKSSAEVTDFFSIVKGFREVCTGELLKLIEPDSAFVNSAVDKSIVENWLLEIKFWNLIEVLIGFRYSDEYHDDPGSLQIRESSSQVIIKDYILRKDHTLRELDLLSYWLVHNLQLDDEDGEDSFDEDTLQSTKWLNTKIDLQSNHKRPDLVTTLDADATLRNNQANKRARKINEKDLKNDELFFKQVFKLLLEEKHDEILQLCEATNNWTLSAIMAGAQDYVDPDIDSSVFKTGDDDDDESMADLDSASKPTGIKNKLLWRRTVYLLASNPNLSKYEKAVYSFLCADYVGYDLTASWERQLLIFVNNILQHDLEDELIKIDSSSFTDCLKLSKPDKKFQTVNEVLNFLSKNENHPEVKRQSTHSIRVLMGSIITNNVGQLVKNSIQLLDQLILSNDKFRNDSHLSPGNHNNLIQESYLLRILIHFIIFVKFLDDDIISDDNLVKLIKIYITRLSLYKLYDLIPIYISYIPSHADIVENYSFFLSNIIVDKEDRLSQLKHMRNLDLPLEEILKKTVERLFQDTESYYESRQDNASGSILLAADKLDLKLIGSVSCFVDAKMLNEWVEFVILLSRRFAATGKIGALIELYNSFNVAELLNEYRIEKDIMNDYLPGSSEDSVLPGFQVEEISQYQLLIQVFTSIEEFSASDSSESLKRTIDSVYSFITSWFVILSKTCDDLKDLELFDRLRALYIPNCIFKFFKIINENQSSEFVREFKRLVNIISSEKYQIYKIFLRTGTLKELLQMSSQISILLFSSYDNGIYSN